MSTLEKQKRRHFLSARILSELQNLYMYLFSVLLPLILPLLKITSLSPISDGDLVYVVSQMESMYKILKFYLNIFEKFSLDILFIFKMKFLSLSEHNFWV